MFPPSPFVIQSRVSFLVPACGTDPNKSELHQVPCPLVEKHRLVAYATCSKCGAAQYSRLGAFCTRCGATLYQRIDFRFARLPRYHGAPRTHSGWQSVPFIVRSAIYGIILLSVGLWLLVILAIFVPHSPRP